jgi:hypothetical protein
MTALLVQVRRATGEIDQIVVDADRVLIGSGGHCDIRLAIDEASIEHLMFQASPNGLYVQALSFDPPPTINGIPFTQGPLPTGAIVSIGNIQFGAGLTEAVATQPKKKERTSPITVIALVGILIGGYVTFFVDEPPAKDAAPREAPAIFSPPAATCAQPSREQALALAYERLAGANSKRERRPFFVQDGIQAVPLFEQAAACFQVAGDMASAADAKGAAELLRADIDTDYRTHRVRLEHFLGVQDLAAARREVRLLLQFTEGKQDDYVTWLGNLDRKLKRKLGRSES